MSNEQSRKSNSVSHKIAMQSYCSIKELWKSNFSRILYEYVIWLLSSKDERIEGVGKQGAEQNIWKYEKIK